MADNVSLDGTPGTRTVAAGNDFNITGTSAAETIQVQRGGLASFGANQGDRVDVEGNLSDYTVSSGGTTLTLTDAAAGWTECAPLHVSRTAPAERGDERASPGAVVRRMEGQAQIRRHCRGRRTGAPVS